MVSLIHRRSPADILILLQFMVCCGELLSKVGRDRGRSLTSTCSLCLYVYEIIDQSDFWHCQSTTFVHWINRVKPYSYPATVKKPALARLQTSLPPPKNKAVVRCDRGEVHFTHQSRARSTGAYAQ